MNAAVGPDKEVSAKVTSDILIVAERPMYFNSNSIDGGHDVNGVTTPRPTWYFAEGYTGNGFQEWLCLQNPNSTPTTATITYMFRGGGTKVQNVYIGANTRETVDVNSAVGENKEVSVKVESTQPIVAERPMYFNFDGINGGHNVAGAESPSTTWYFAEGYTGSGFQEYLTLLNPSPTPANVTIEYTFRRGGGTTQSITVGENTRETIDANAAVGPNREVSCLIRSIRTLNPVLFERFLFQLSPGCL